MILNLHNLRQHTLRKGLAKTAAHIIVEAAITPLDKEWDVFLSYSRRDRNALPEVIDRLKNEGLTVYVDEEADADLDPNNVDALTAERIRARLLHSQALFVLTSRNASGSRWVPWELGFADGAGKRVAVLPFIDSNRNILRFKGNEYLGLYPWLDDTLDDKNVRFLWATDSVSSNFYCRLDHWLDGNELSQH